MSAIPEVELDDLAADRLLSQNSIDYIWKDLLAGSYSGLIITLSGFPFDTLKIRMQMYNTSLVQSIKGIFAEGKTSKFAPTSIHFQFKSVFNGMAFPFYSVPLVNAIVFSSYEFFKRYLASINVTDSFSQGLYAGMFCGLVNSFVVSPIELVKCRLQIQDDNCCKRKRYFGSWHCTRRVFKEEGLSGMYRGTVATILREVPAYAAQFLAYELIKEYCINTWNRFEYTEKGMAGGTAGVLCWIASYPQDIIKTKLQCDLMTNYFKPKYQNYGTLIRDGGFLQCAIDIYRTEGFRGYWRGFSACMIRAFYANALGFIAYEQAREFLFGRL